MSALSPLDLIVLMISSTVFATSLLETLSQESKEESCMLKSFFCEFIISINQLGRSQWFPCHEHSGFQVAKIIYFYVGVFGEKTRLEEPPKWAQVKDFPKLS